MLATPFAIRVLTTAAVFGFLIFGWNLALSQSNCDQTVSSANATLNQANTVYCLTANVGGNGTVNITANNITLDGQGFRFTGSASIQATNRTGTIIKNVDVGGGEIGIEGGTSNQLLDSEAGYLDIRQTTGATVRGNTVTNIGETAILVGDNTDTPNPSVWTDNILIENNTFTGNGNVNTRFIYMRHMRNSTFRNNTITLTNASFSVSGGEPTDNSTLGVMFTSYNNTISGNNFSLDIAPTHEQYRDQQYIGGAFLIRSASSNNIVENNTFISDAGRGVSVQSSGGYSHPENNTIRGNIILEHNKALWVQAVREGSQSNIFERNIIVATDGMAIDASGVQANARAVFDHNTIVAKNGDAIWGDGTDTSRQVIFTNNIISATSGYAFRLENLNFTSNYNNLRRTNAGSLIWYNGSTYGGLAQWKATGRDANSISSDPQFVNAASHDYHLSAGSPSLTADSQGGQQGAYTSSPACTESWSCGAWSACVNDSQSRSCTDANACGTVANRPPLTQSCTAPDTTAPTVSLVAPTNGATVSGTVAISASASDDIEVAGVTFYVNGTPIESEDANAPYSVNWDTTSVPNGNTRTITAVARDTANNSATSAAVTVTVQQAAGCTENWSCDDWSVCTDGSQARTCTDANNCGTATSRPPQTQSCSSPQPPIDDEPPAAINNLQAS